MNVAASIQPAIPRFLAAVCALLAIRTSGSLAQAATTPPATDTRIVHLRCDSLENPLGIDDLQPRLSWQMDSARRGASQKAYRVLVASTPTSLRSGHPDMWDSGRVPSDTSIEILYAGKPLLARHPYFWTVQVWDEQGRLAEASETAQWEMALQSSADWRAQWISSDQPEEVADRAAAPHWIWTDGEDALKHAHRGSRQFRLAFELAKQPVEAVLLITAKDKVSAAVNGSDVLGVPAAPTLGPAYPWGTFRRVDVTKQLILGRNVLTSQVDVEGPSDDNFAGLIALLRIKLSDGSTVRYVSDDTWISTATATSNWKSASFDAHAWRPARVVAQIGETPFGTPWMPKPADIFRTSILLKKPVRSARLYITALGSYQARLNGQGIGKEILAPGWTDYRARLNYQTYDVTSMLRQGTNALAVLLGDGWYGSGLVWYQQRFNFGPPPLRLLAELRVDFDDGTSQTFGSDSTWKTHPSAIQASDLYNGERFDAREEQRGWDLPSFRPRDSWRNAVPAEKPQAALAAQNFQPIRIEQELHAKALTSPSPGVYLFDMGQNLVGTERLIVKGPRGTEVRLRFGEVLESDGRLYHENMRTAAATDTYTLRGGGAREIFVPHFTYHGYRYVEVTGYPGKPGLDAVTGLVFHTDAPFTMRLNTGSTMVNQLWSNILWGQRGNFESIPTDCPQRDERLGWMGDAQVFWRTASYNMDLAAFSRKFAMDMRIAQSPKGNFSDITPRVGTAVGDGSPGWADAGIIIPYVAARQFGDTRLLAESWPSMERYMTILAAENPDFVNHREAYGDWLAIGSKTPQPLISTAYWAYDAQLMASMAKMLGKADSERRYTALYERIRQAFQKNFVRPDGSVGSNSQTSYVLALHMDLVPADLRSTVADRLVQDLASHQGHLTTGFLGTPYLMSILSNTGHTAVAYKLLLNESYPSWGYMVAHGATTMWERWNGDQMLNDPSMNSFNHYAYGAVGEWLYRYAAGIDLGSRDQAFHHFELQPQFDPALGHLEVHYDSAYGSIVSSWSCQGNNVDWTATIPANTSAHVVLPNDGKSQLLVEGRPLSAATEGISAQAAQPGKWSFEAAAGTYHFSLRHEGSMQALSRAR